MFYTLDVIEVVHRRVRYTIEANSPSESLEKAFNGETSQEHSYHEEGVVDRICQTEPRKVQTKHYFVILHNNHVLVLLTGVPESLPDKLLLLNWYAKEYSFERN